MIVLVVPVRYAVSCRVPRLARAATGARTLYGFLRVTTHARVMRRPWSAPAAWNFVAALLASPGLAVLVPTQRHADVAEEVILELPCRQSAPRRAHGHSYAGTRQRANLHPRHRFQSISVPRSSNRGRALMRLPQTDSGPSAILIDEFNASKARPIGEVVRDPPPRQQDRGSNCADGMRPKSYISSLRMVLHYGVSSDRLHVTIPGLPHGFQFKAPVCSEACVLPREGPCPS